MEKQAGWEQWKTLKHKFESRIIIIMENTYYEYNLRSVDSTPSHCNDNLTRPLPQYLDLFIGNYRISSATLIMYVLFGPYVLKIWNLIF